MNPLEEMTKLKNLSLPVEERVKLVRKYYLDGMDECLSDLLGVDMTWDPIQNYLKLTESIYDDVKEPIMRFDGFSSRFMRIVGGREGHLVAQIITNSAEWVGPSPGVTWDSLVQKDSKGKFGLENLGCMQIEYGGEYVPLTFRIFGAERYHFIPFKFKKEAFTADQCIKTLCKHNVDTRKSTVIALKNYIELREGAYFVTRKLTYYLMIIEHPAAFVKPQTPQLIHNRTYIQLIMFCYGFGDRSDMAFCCDEQIWVGRFKGIVDHHTPPVIITQDFIQYYGDAFAKLEIDPGLPYIRWRQIMTTLSFMRKTESNT